MAKNILMGRVTDGHKVILWRCEGTESAARHMCERPKAYEISTLKSSAISAGMDSHVELREILKSY